MREKDELIQLFEGLEPQARLVLLDIGRRLKAGQQTYGVMDVHGDGRDYFAEAAEEAMDFVVYAAMERLKREGKKLYRMRPQYVKERHDRHHPLEVSDPGEVKCEVCAEDLFDTTYERVL